MHRIEVFIHVLREGQGTTTADATGNGNDGTLNDAVEWVAGYKGGAVRFDTGGERIVIGPLDPSGGTNAMTLAAWIKWQGSGNSITNQGIIGKRLGWPSDGGTIKWFWQTTATGDLLFRADYNGGGTTMGWGNAALSTHANEWTHVAVTWSAGTAIQYINGEELATGSITLRDSANATPVTIGCVDSTNSETFVGIIDEVQFYDEALTAAKIQEAMTAEFSVASSSGPVPQDNATDVLRDVVLSWTPGEYAATHNVYFGTDADAVAAADAANPNGLLVGKGQTETSYDPEGLLEFGKTYFWRVDEVNAPTAGGTVYKGNVWRFTTEPYSIPITDVNATADSTFDASSLARKTVDGSGLNTTTDTHGTAASDMWISGTAALPHWIQYSFDKVYKLDQMWVWNSNQTLEGMFGLGAKGVLVQVSTDGTTWTDLGTFQFTKAPGNATCAADTKVPFNGAAARYVKLNITSNWGGLFSQGSLSEVRFYAIPSVAREPSPADAAANLHPQVAMSWRAGRDAASHEVHIGADANEVLASTTPTATVTAAEYDAALALGQTYYWKVVEVNPADPTGWASPVWSFSTAAYITVDDFEGYTNDSPKRVFQTWIDGSGFSPDEFFPNGNSGNGTGSLVGEDPTLGDIMELVYICDGKQSMPLSYDNSASPKISEAIRTLDPAKDTTDWTKFGLTTLVLFFRGDATNGAAPIYVKINNTKKVYGTAAATTIPFWRQWNIDLASIPAADLKNVQTLTIGVGDGSANGSGKIIVDSIRLYAAAPAVAVPADPGTTGLIAYYAMNGDAQDASGNGNNGTLTGEPSFADGMTGFGKALALDGVNDCVDLGNKAVFNPTGSFSVSLWANITAWGTGWNHVMIGNRGESGIGWQIRRHVTTSLCFTTRGVDQDDMASVMTPPQNKWMNIVCVYDDAASTKAIYIDGHQDRLINTTAGSHVAATTMNTFIGARAAAANTPEAFFTGQLDEIRLFNRALTAGEAAYLAGDR